MTSIVTKKVGETFEGFLLIKDVSKGVTSNGNPFLTLILQDRSGEIEAKLWEATEKDEEMYLRERIVFVHGIINQFRGKNQLRINKIRLSTEIDKVSVYDFIPKSPIDVNNLQQKLFDIINCLENKKIQQIVLTIVEKYQDKLFKYPAAVKNHHEYSSGLLHHTVSMLMLAEKICELYPDINKDLLYAGVILHDIGKIKELSGIVSTSYTTKGKLLGHISLMVEEIKLISEDLSIEGEEVLLLQHMVLSHHGQLEWGSPKRPLLREAELLHLIDLIDSRMNMLSRSLENVKEGEFTEPIFALDRRSFYKPKI